MSQNLKHFFVNLVKFLLFAMFVYLILLFAWGFLIPEGYQKNLKFVLGGQGHLFTRLQDADTTRNVDILFLGTSHSYRGYDPRLFAEKGICIFNLGSSSQAPEVSKRLLKKYIGSMNPKLVVFDVFPSQFAMDGIESKIDFVSNKRLLFPEDFALAFEGRNAKLINTYLFSLLYQTFEIYENFKEQAIKKTGTYIQGGYVESHNKKNKISDMFAPANLKATDENLQILDSVCAILNQKGIPFILVQSPVSKAYYDHITNNAEWDSLFSHRGPYLNFNESLSLKDEYFYDAHHMNQAGVAIFDSVFLDKIQKQFISIKK